MTIKRFVASYIDDGHGEGGKVISSTREIDISGPFNGDRPIQIGVDRMNEYENGSFRTVRVLHYLTKQEAIELHNLLATMLAI